MRNRQVEHRGARPSLRPYGIVVGLDCIQGLQSARVLARHDVPVLGIARHSRYYACATRACAEVLFTNTGSEKLVDLLEHIGPTFTHKPVLIPCQDKNVLVIARHAKRLSAWYQIVLPDADVVEMMMDKAAFYRFAGDRGLPIPTTFVLDDRLEAERAVDLLTYPCILKPSLRLTEWSRHTKAKAMIVHDAADLLRLYDQCRTWSPALIAQDMILGNDDNHYTCNCYVNRDGEVLVTFTSQKLRQWQPVTGQACLAVEARNDVVELATRELFTSVAYRGLGYLEMKRDDRTGDHFIIEPNIGRPTGRSALAEAAGVELLYTMYCDASGSPLPANREQQYRGVKWIHLLRDLQASVYHYRRRELTMRQWWRSIRGEKTEAIFAIRDPMPFIKAVVQAFPVLRSARERRNEED